MVRLIKVDHNLTEDQIEWCKNHPQIDRSEHIRRALDLYIAKITEEEFQSHNVAVSSSQVVGKGVNSGPECIPSASPES